MEINTIGKKGEKKEGKSSLHGDKHNRKEEEKSDKGIKSSLHHPWR